MVNIRKETLGEALDILQALLAGKKVSLNENRELYDRYLSDNGVEECVSLLTEKMGLELFRYDDQLFITPGVGNVVFGWSNEELRKRIPWVQSNTDLYLCYFVIVVIITMFYGLEVPYCKLDRVVTEVTDKFNALLRLEDIETVSHETQYNFAAIAKAWRNRTEITRKEEKEEPAQYGIMDKRRLVHTVCRFLKDENLFVIDEERQIILPTSRFKAIIYHYFEQRENKNRVLELVYGSGEVEPDATY